MSMGMGLHGTRNFLRAQYQWDEKHCGIQFNCIPPATAGQYYIALDDAGVETGRDDTDALTEVLNIEIGIWRRTGGKPADRLGHLKMPDDLYLANILTLTDLERRIIVPHENAQTGGLHMNWGLRTAINTQFGLPNETMGPEFIGPLVYRGMGRLESIALPESPNTTFYGRKLRFRGLQRTQILRGSRSCTG